MVVKKLFLKQITVLWPPGGTSIETLYGDVPPKWVGFWQKSLNMGPIFDPQIPKHGSIFRQNHKNFLGSQREPRKFSKNP